MAIVTPLCGHTSEETAYLVNDYPYGRTVRCRIRYWLETDDKRGTRFCSQTENPKTLRWNAPKKSTYSDGPAALYLDEKGHVTWSGVNSYSKPADVTAFVLAFGASDLSLAQAALVLARAHVLMELRFASGQTYFTINGVKREPSETAQAAHAKGAAEWREVVKVCRKALGQDDLELAQ